MYNVVGNFLTLSSFGESHGEAYGGIITNFPAGLEIDIEKVQQELDRRKPGQSAIVTQRKEGDKVRFLSGIFDGKTALCGIEQAYNQGIVDWKKPVSCHLYPIRIKEYSDFAAVNYHKWHICDDACSLGQELGVPVYQFVKEALVRKFGQQWFDELDKVAKELKK